MTSGAGSEQHSKVDYAETETDAPRGTFSVTWAPDGKKATLAGHCPECHGRTSTEFAAGIPGTRGFRGSPHQLPTLDSPVTLYCECGHAHNGRPDAAPDKGCGRFWLVHIDAKQRVDPRHLS